MKKDNKKIYRIFYEFIFYPSMHFGVDRKKCKCKLCPDKVISKESNIYVTEGEEFYNEPEDTMVVVKGFDAAYDYLMSKYEGDNFDNYGYFDEETNNPNGNDESEFSDGFGDEELNIYKIEVLDYESEKIIETHNM